jgi:AraC-like DNA-binding protein
MRPPLLKNIESAVQSLTLQHLDDPYFDPNWHFHPHYQLFTVLEGKGTRLVGDSIQPFEPGDTVFLGPDIPHLWRCEENYFQPDSTLMTRGIVLYFQEGFLGKDFFDRPEFFSIRELLKLSARGLSYKGDTRDMIIEELIQWSDLSAFDRLIRLLQLLNTLAHSTDSVPLTSYGYVNNFKPSETERMQKVHTYILQNFTREIRLSEIASLAGMSEGAFCRYFKVRANKTVTDFISEVRIGHACRLLVNKEWNIARIAFECGFDTLSNFNRQFKKITLQTPTAYRNTLIGE